jgi:hypothetical protein
MIRAEAEKLGLLVSECYLSAGSLLVEGVTDLACPENVGRLERRMRSRG